MTKAPDTLGVVLSTGKIDLGGINEARIRRGSGFPA